MSNEALVAEAVKNTVTKVFEDKEFSVVSCDVSYCKKTPNLLVDVSIEWAVQKNPLYPMIADCYDVDEFFEEHIFSLPLSASYPDELLGDAEDNVNSIIDNIEAEY